MSKKFKILTKIEKEKINNIHSKINQLQREIEERYIEMGLSEERIDAIFGGHLELGDNSLHWLGGACMELEEAKRMHRWAKIEDDEIVIVED